MCTLIAQFESSIAVSLSRVKYVCLIYDFFGGGGVCGIYYFGDSKLDMLWTRDGRMDEMESGVHARWCLRATIKSLRKSLGSITLCVYLYWFSY